MDENDHFKFFVLCVGTLKTGYPAYKLQVKDERQDDCTCPCVPWLPSPATGQLRSRHMPRSSSSRRQGPR
jgi:hypothetical protein